MKRAPSTRFWSKVEVLGPTDCWEWTAALRNGYGVFWTGSKVDYAHRFCAEQVFGPSECPVVRHKCDNRACVNPGHLLWGTQAENIQDAVKRGRHYSPACSKERNGRAKITSKQAEEIRKDNRTRREISNDYGISVSQIYRIKTGECWK